MSLSRWIVLGLLLAAGSGLGAAPQLQSTVQKVRIAPGWPKTRLAIDLSGPVKYRAFRLGAPERLVLDIEKTGVAHALQLDTQPDWLVSALRHGPRDGGDLRLILDLRGKAQHKVFQLKPDKQSGHRLIVDLVGKERPAAERPVAEKTPVRPVTALPAAPLRNVPKPADPVPVAADVKTIPTPTLTGPSTAALLRSSSSIYPSRSGVSIPVSAGIKTMPEPPSAIPGTATTLRSSSSVYPSRSGVSVPVSAGITTMPEAPLAVPSTATAFRSPPSVYRPRGRVPRNASLRARLSRLVAGPTAYSRSVVVAIDAGHGGVDTGAHGSGGSREKEITLAVARQLAGLIDAEAGMRSVLVRDGDFFVPLRRRMEKARRHRADLFVSIHADAFPDADARGASVFVLSERGASSEAARRLADRENAADLVSGVRLTGKDPMLASVLLDMSQTATKEASMHAARSVLDGLQRVGNVHKYEVQRAGFAVLKSPDVPSMLVETAFISNPQEERRLRDPGYQRQVCAAILAGIKQFFRDHPPDGAGVRVASSEE